MHLALGTLLDDRFNLGRKEGIEPLNPKNKFLFKVLVCRSQFGNWRQHCWTIFDLVICGFALSSLLAMRITASSGWLGWPSAYEIRASWAFFLLYECHKTIFLFVPLSNVLGPMLVRIRLMITRDLVK